MAIWKKVRFVLFVVAGLAAVAVIAFWRGDDQPEDTGFADKSMPGVQQVVVVQGANAGGTKVGVSIYEIGSDGSWKRTKGPYSGRIGTNGFRSIENRTEGDGTTPRGVFPLPSAFGAEGAPGGTKLPYTVVQQGQCWISDVNDPAYNRWVNRTPCPAPNVDLWAKSRPGEKFHTAIVIGYNTELRRPGAGSALFFHLSELDNKGRPQGTAGGVGLSESNLRSILRALDPTKNPVAILGPKDWINSPATT